MFTSYNFFFPKKLGLQFLYFSRKLGNYLIFKNFQLENKGLVLVESIFFFLFMTFVILKEIQTNVEIQTIK